MKAMEAVSRRQNEWAELIWQQRRSNLSVSAFCREHSVSDQSFYNTRKRLAASEAVRFALVETGVANAPLTQENAALELIFCSGERLRIAPGADMGMLRTVLSVLRERA
jgi:hypothetical protein